MRACFLNASVLLLCAIPLGADTYTLSKSTFNGQEMLVAEYLQGKNYRTEVIDQGRSRSVSIRNLEQGIWYEIDLQSHKYSETTFKSSPILSLAQWIARPPRVHESGKTVNIYYETIDTGERKEFFGQAAKHLVFRERHVAESGACDASYQTERDGWYIPRDGIREVGPRLSISNLQCHDHVVTHGEHAPPGLPVVETYQAWKREVLELSTAPLDRSLFQIPKGFEKVDALPGRPRPVGSEQGLAWEWAQLANAFESWFR